MAEQAAQLSASQAGSGSLPPLPGDPAVTSLAADYHLSIQEAQRRIGWQEPANQLGEELTVALGERFGGLWIDPDDGGRVKVGVVAPVTAAVAAEVDGLAAKRQLGGIVDLVPVRYGYAWLEAANAWIGKAADAARVASPPTTG